MKPGVFDSRYVMAQLNCQGVMETVEVMRSGLPHRIAYDSLLQLFRPDQLPKGALLAKLAARGERQLTTAVMWANGAVGTTYRLGNTSVYLRAKVRSASGFLGAVRWLWSRWRSAACCPPAGCWSAGASVSLCCRHCCAASCSD
jgi:hypothetical protein